MRKLLLITTAETDLLTLARAATLLPPDFPRIQALTPADLEDVDALCTEAAAAQLAIIRLLGGSRALPGFPRLVATCRSAGIPLLAQRPDPQPDGELAAATTVPAEVATAVDRYFAEGGAANLANGLRLLADRVFGTAYGFQPPIQLPHVGLYHPSRPEGESLAEALARIDPDRPTVGLIFYRAHWLAGNLAFVDALVHRAEEAGANVLAVFCLSLRANGAAVLRDVFQADGRRRVDVVVNTTSFAMARSPGRAPGEGDDDGLALLEELDMPIVQAVVSTDPMAAWRERAAGLSPVDAVMSVALPEFDGRVAGPPIAFKAERDRGRSGGDLPLPVYVPHADGIDRAIRLALAWARLRRRPNGEKRIGIVLACSPTRNARIGSAVGLDTPASLLNLLRAMRQAGYAVGDLPATGDELIHHLIDRATYDREFLMDGQLAGAERMATADYRRWFAGLPETARATVEQHWGPAPGTLYLTDGGFGVAGLRLGNVFIMIQPPRGYDDQPGAIYHSPDLPPSHHYLACYRWLRDVFRADGVVHLGKHGTLEWLPGKSLGLSAGCFPAAALDDLPNVYPFIVDDPGEGAQAKRRGAAVVVDHLPPVVVEAGSYGDTAELSRLLEEYDQAQIFDPGRRPVLEEQIWQIAERSGLATDVGFDKRPREFAEFAARLDAILCELRDWPIRDGLHVLGEPPRGERLVEFLTAVLAGATGPDRAATREAIVRALEGGQDALGEPLNRLLSAVARTTDEIQNVLRALGGGYVLAGPSGAPTRGVPQALPTGRNFYNVDPLALPSSSAWIVGQALAEALLAEHTRNTGALPETVGIVAWGTSAMRTQGDDVAQVLALLGARPIWQLGTGRVLGLEPVPLEELGRPRVDVTVRISGFFRDAFPNLVALMDQAIDLVAGLDEGDDVNYVARHTRRDLARRLALGSAFEEARRESRYRIFGSKPGSYGAGLLQLIEGRNWKTDEDIAAVYSTWGQYAYGQGTAGAAAPEAFRERFAAIEAAAKNRDNAEHDIFDSDDYFQFHGGMVATVRVLTGRQPRAYIGDSANPSDVKVRPLEDEARRVYRARLVNPRWIAAIQRHGYKGAAEMMASVDYLFGYDATAGVADDTMYTGLAERYACDPALRAFFEEKNPWALRGIIERLLEAAQRGLWEHPPEDLLAELRRIYLEIDARLEARYEPATGAHR
ncbi:MAG: cobaltochelatase subunit CobN [Chloroflexi bacterium]|nr:cobaltochelatase subunit CobN [Chloroflexota bacterium]